MGERCIYVNGEFYSEEDAKVSVFDHGFLYGDGIFEGIRFYNYKIFRFEEHMERLYKSAKAIALEVPLEISEFSEKIKEAVRCSKLSDGYIRVIVSRGAGDLGLDARKCKEPGVVIIPSSLKMYPQEMYDEGISIVTAATRRNGNEMTSPRVKSLNYLNNVMAKLEAAQADSLEALMLSQEGYVVECTGDNIFHVSQGTLYTPATFHGVLDGITRAVIIEIAKRLGIPVVEGTVTRYDLYTADECFLTGTGAEAIPVVKIDNRVLGSGKPGEMTLKLINEFRKTVEGEGDDVR